MRTASITGRERATLLAALYDLSITYYEHRAVFDRIVTLVEKLGGDRNDVHFGGEP